LTRDALALALLALAACSKIESGAPEPPLPGAQAIVVKGEALALNPADPAQDRVGDFVYAGGLKLTSAQTRRLHGLSDIDVQPDGAMVAVGDEGDLLHARLMLDPQGRLAGLTDARLSALTDLNGKALRGKDNRDSEGLALLADGDLLISFERQDRIWLYPKDGGRPRAVPSPQVKFPYNEGMEALAPDPAHGPTAYFTGGETTGRTWSCTLTSACVEGAPVPLDLGFGLVAARSLPNGGTAWLMRAFNPTTRSVVDLRITDEFGKTIDKMELRLPLTVDNFEGLAAVPQAGGAIRFYLISDDNFSSSQRTLLVAFDWKPPTTSGR
jgi:hypothetical protein